MRIVLNALAILAAIISSAGFAAAETKFYASKPCGTRANTYFCATIRPDSNDTGEIAKFKVDFPRSGKAQVFWTANAFCSVDAKRTAEQQSVAEATLENYVHLALKKDTKEFGQFNEPGSVSLGEYIRSYVVVIGGGQMAVDAAQRILLPVNITNLYDVKKGESVFRILYKRDFRVFHENRDNFCNVNSGKFIVNFSSD